MKTAATQTAPVVVGSPDPEVFFWKTELGVEDALCSQCGGWGSHWWHPATWALGPNGACRKLCAYPENPLGVKPREQRGACSHRCGDPCWDVEIRGPAAPPSAVAEQAGSGGPVGLGFSAISRQILGPSPITWRCC